MWAALGRTVSAEQHAFACHQARVHGRLPLRVVSVPASAIFVGSMGANHAASPLANRYPRAPRSSENIIRLKFQPKGGRAEEGQVRRGPHAANLLLETETGPAGSGAL
jgi:hypothetical protein